MGYACVLKSRNENDFVVMKIDLRNAFNLVSCKLSLRNAGNTFLSSSNGQHGVMVIIPYCCLPWVH